MGKQEIITLDNKTVLIKSLLTARQRAGWRASARSSVCRDFDYWLSTRQQPAAGNSQTTNTYIHTYVNMYSHVGTNHTADKLTDTFFSFARSIWVAFVDSQAGDHITSRLESIVGREVAVNCLSTFYAWVAKRNASSFTKFV